MNSRKGFSLIELLISAIIIAILTSIVLVVINPSQVRGKARDAERVSDLRTIQVALEQYYFNRRAYPSSKPTSSSTTHDAFILVSGTDRLTTCLLGTGSSPCNLKVSNEVPVDPNPGTSNGSDTPCTSIGYHRYNYWAPRRSSSDTESADKFVLAAIMETESSNDGFECGGLKNWPSGCGGSIESGVSSDCPGSQFGTCNYCYGVESR